MIVAIVFASLGVILGLVAINWIGDIRIELATLKARVGKHQEALDLQLAFDHSVNEEIERLGGRGASLKGVDDHG